MRMIQDTQQAPPNPMLRRLLPVLILAGGLGGFVVLKETRPNPHPVTRVERVWRVEAVDVAPSDHRPVLSLFGRVEAPDRVRAAAPVTGRLLDVMVRDGELVAKGAPLARIDPRDLQPRLMKARAEVEKEQLRLSHDGEALEQERELLRLAESGVSRADQVQTKKLGSAAEVDEARQQLARARLAVTLREQSIAEHPARLASLQATLAEAERDVARGEIAAPFAARIGVVEAAAGDQLQANQTILTLIPVDGLYLRAKIPGTYAEELRDALDAGTRLPAEGHHAGKTVTAVMERLAGEADARGVDALLRLDPGADLPLGAFVDLRLDRPVASGTLALPFAALHGGDRIFAVKEGRLTGVPVERVGETAGTESQPGLVLVRAPTLKTGMPVMVSHLPNALDSLKVETIQ
ncbi:MULTISPECIES: efflux RND transporter periplasmic adaptor subunit [unclassified Thiocapsa]|uniref:efflux RND transporter periplasmic adaptor subunit n=1 Tax=unclassified Thiocapsa TaxID=2641286 RepID=UPI0035B29AA4